jgi:hypothetical protein
MADVIGWPCETVIASIREPSDFAGLPVVIGQEVRFRHQWLVQDEVREFLIARPTDITPGASAGDH